MLRREIRALHVTVALRLPEYQPTLPPACSFQVLEKGEQGTRLTLALHHTPFGVRDMRYPISCS